MADEQVLDLWFPEDGHWSDLENHGAFWETRMQGGMDEVICREFGPLTEAAARGELDHWADAPRSRLALLIALGAGAGLVGGLLSVRRTAAGLW